MKLSDGESGAPIGFESDWHTPLIVNVMRQHNWDRRIAKAVGARREACSALKPLAARTKMRAALPDHDSLDWRGTHATRFFRASIYP